MAALLRAVHELVTRGYMRHREFDTVGRREEGEICRANFIFITDFLMRTMTQHRDHWQSYVHAGQGVQDTEGMTNQAMNKSEEPRSVQWGQWGRKYGIGARQCRSLALHHQRNLN